MRRCLLPALTLLLLILMPLEALAVSFRREFQSLENLYERGELAELAAQLRGSNPRNDEERALQTFLNAMLKKGRDDTLILLQQAIDRYPSTYYGQLSKLEKAKIHILERQIPQAETLLKSITSPEIPQRFYWLSQCALHNDDFGAAIAQGENYLRADPGGPYTEESHYQITAAYQNQNKLHSAIATLEKLRALPGLPKNRQYFHYLLGRLHHLSGNCAEAYQNYKQGFELNKRSQLAFEIEEQLTGLKASYGSQVDLSFLYPYTRLELPELVFETLAPAVPPQAELDPNAPVKLEARPSGVFVQAGRFGSEANAARLTNQIRGLELKASYFEDQNNRSVPWVVVSGPYATQSEAESVRQILRANSIDCFVTRF